MFAFPGVSNDNGDPQTEQNSFSFEFSNVQRGQASCCELEFETLKKKHIDRPNLETEKSLRKNTFTVCHSFNRI